LEPTEAWLVRINQALRAQDVPPRQRPFLAWRAYADEHHLALAFDNPTVKRIFEWFQANTQTGSQLSGPLFSGAYFFDASFWPLEVPLLYGAAELNVWASLRTMPQALKAAVARHQEAMAQLIDTWTSAVDYAFSFNDLMRPPPPQFALALLLSADRELRGIGDLLLAPRPSAKAAHSAALAIELVGKFFLARRANLNDAAARELGHNLVAILSRCGEEVPVRDLSVLIERARLLPGPVDRYAGAEPPPRYLWEAYLTALVTAANLLRPFTNRDVGASINVQGQEHDSV
jgi:hypothetical protein